MGWPWLPYIPVVVDRWYDRSGVAAQSAPVLLVSGVRDRQAFAFAYQWYGNGIASTEGGRDCEVRVKRWDDDI